MAQTLRAGRGFIAGVVMLGLLTTGYVVVDDSLVGNAPGASSVVTGAGLGTTPTTASATPADVPDATVQKVASSVSDVVGLNELVVLPSADGKGVTVSAMVDLGDHSAPRSTWLPQVRRAVQQYLYGVYQSGAVVENAQVYFTQNGEIVAGAGLGKQAYLSMAAEASTGQSNFVQTLESQPTVTNEGTKDSWFETQTTANAP